MRRHEAALFSVAWTGLVLGGTVGALLGRLGRTKEMRRYANAFYMWRDELAEALDGDVFPEVDGPIERPVICEGDLFDLEVAYPVGTVVQRESRIPHRDNLRIVKCRDGLWHAEWRSHWTYDENDFARWGDVYVVEVGP